jgi:hypothetical protein
MIILMNGPPGSGKDMAATYFKKDLPNAYEVKASQPLKKAFRALFQFGDIQARTMLNEQKDQELVALSNMTPRQVQIELSSFMKHHFGAEILGHILARTINQLPYNYFIVSDIGFQEETEALVKVFGNRIKCIQLSRPHCNFDNDSRGYIDCETLGIDLIKIHNEHDLEMYRRQLQRAWIKWNLPVRESAQKLG